MVRETWVQSQVMSYQRLKKWYLILPCLTLSNIRYESRVKWSNPGKGVAPSPTFWCCSYWKGSLLVALDYGRQLYFTYMYKNRFGIKYPTMVFSPLLLVANFCQKNQLQLPTGKSIKRINHSLDNLYLKQSNTPLFWYKMESSFSMHI